MDIDRFSCRTSHSYDCLCTYSLTFFLKNTHNRYASHALKEIFNVHELDLVSIAKSFGFSVPPRVHLPLKNSGKKVHRGRKRNNGRKGNFSSDHPYGRAGEQRQFSR
jgi:ATP-dependent RNA helicase DDX18/HAS1